VPYPNDEQLEALQAEELKKIESLVKPLLPQASIVDSQRRQIHIEIVDPIVNATRAKPALANDALAWSTQHWGTLSILGFASFGFLLLRSTSRQRVSQTSESIDSNPELLLHRTTIESSPSPQTALADFVRHNPNTTATIFRNWIGNAS
jgi:hypothetical protein